VSVHEVKRSMLDDWRAELEKKGLRASTTRNVLAYFRSFLR
jgi:integrase